MVRERRRADAPRGQVPQLDRRVGAARGEGVADGGVPGDGQHGVRVAALAQLGLAARLLLAALAVLVLAALLVLLGLAAARGGRGVVAAVVAVVVLLVLLRLGRRRRRLLGRRLRRPRLDVPAQRHERLHRVEHVEVPHVDARLHRPDRHQVAAQGGGGGAVAAAAAAPQVDARGAQRERRQQHVVVHVQVGLPPGLGGRLLVQPHLERGDVVLVPPGQDQHVRRADRKGVGVLRVVARPLGRVLVVVAVRVGDGALVVVVVVDVAAVGDRAERAADQGRARGVLVRLRVLGEAHVEVVQRLLDRLWGARAGVLAAGGGGGAAAAAALFAAAARKQGGGALGARDGRGTVLLVVAVGHGRVAVLLRVVLLLLIRAAAAALRVRAVAAPERRLRGARRRAPHRLELLLGRGRGLGHGLGHALGHPREGGDHFWRVCWVRGMMARAPRERGGGQKSAVVDGWGFAPFRPRFVVFRGRPAGRVRRRYLRFVSAVGKVAKPRRLERARERRVRKTARGVATEERARAQRGDAESGVLVVAVACRAVDDGWMRE